MPIRSLVVSTGESAQLPVITEDPVPFVLQAPEFDRSLGTLISIEITFLGTMISTAFVTDIFPTGFGTVATGLSNSISAFEPGSGSIDFPNTSVELIATNSTFVFPGGSGSLILNSSNASSPVNATSLDEAYGSGTFNIDGAVAGSFQSFPFGSLPQQGVIYEADVEYFYVTPGDTIPLATQIGTSGNDVMVGTPRSERFEGGDGNDKISGDRGADKLLGGDSRDILDGGVGNDSIIGGNGRDKLLGQAGDDTLKGQSGNDTLKGGIGNDTMNGGNGKDLMYGQSGSDIMRGGNGDDTIFGGRGNDAMNGGRGTDILTGNGGIDRFYFSPEGGFDIIRNFDLEDDQIFLEDHNTSYASLKFTTKGDDVVVRFNADDSVRIRDVTEAELTSDIFDFG